MSDPPCPEWWEDEDVESDARIGPPPYRAVADLQAMISLLEQSIQDRFIDVLLEDAASKYFFWLGAEALR